MARLLGAARTTVAGRRSVTVRGGRGWRSWGVQALYFDASEDGGRFGSAPTPVVLREIYEQDFEGSRTQLKMYLAEVRPAKREEPLIRFETEAGSQTQVALVVFKRCGERLSAFVATLPPYRAKTKGKVDRFNRYLRETF